MHTLANPVKCGAGLGPCKALKRVPFAISQPIWTPSASRNCSILASPRQFERLRFYSNIATTAIRPGVNAVAVGQSQGPPQVPPAEKVEIDSVTCHSIGDNVFLLRGNCTSRLKYEVEYSLKRGTTDNSYLLKLPGSNVLIDVPFEAYSEKYCEALAQLTPLNSLDHVIITYLDPKAIPTLKAVLEKAVQGRSGAKLVVVLSNPALRLLQSALGEKAEEAQLLSDIQLVVARSGTEIAVGEAKLEAVLTPTPRWPDLMSVYYPDQRMLFTSKLFGAHVLPSLVHETPDDKDHVYDSGSWEVFGDDWRYYFDCLLAPQARQMASALEKLDIAPVSGATAKSQAGLRPLVQWLKGMVTGQRIPFPTGQRMPTIPVDVEPHTMEVKVICPMHGPLVTNSISHLLREYRDWTDEQIKVASTNCVAVMYASAYGNTATLAQALSRGVTKGGVAVEMINLETSSVEDVAQAIQESDGFMIGSPTLGGHMPTQVQLALGSIIRQPSAKEMPCGVFGSFGWSGEAVDEMESKLSNAGFKFAHQPIRVKFRPTAKDLQTCEESGRDLAAAIKRKVKAKEAKEARGDAKTSLASGPQLAMGRIVGSLSVLTATDEDASSAMLASWVSQASFDPPGLTVSIKKDRAMEPLLSVDAKFFISMVSEGQEKKVMKALARPFQPGEDRLAGLEVFLPEGADSQTPVLKDCASYLQCRVASRMDAGDHIIVYATVLDGKVVSGNALTAVHHRKVGSHY